MKKDTVSNKNVSGIYPCGDRVLVKPDDFEKKGLIDIPDTVLDRHMDSQTSGTLVAVGPDAWTHFVERSDGVATHRGYSKPFAKEGDKVMFAKFGGQKVWGKDGVQYRVLNDVDITATIDEGVAFHDLESRKTGGVK